MQKLPCAELMAEALFQKGKRIGLMTVLINPAWRFVRGYFRARFDGWRGLRCSLSSSRTTHQKYLKLLLKNRRGFAELGYLGSLSFGSVGPVRDWPMARANT